MPRKIDKPDVTFVAVITGSEIKLKYDNEDLPPDGVVFEIKDKKEPKDHKVKITVDDTDDYSIYGFSVGQDGSDQWTRQGHGSKEHFRIPAEVGQSNAAYFAIVAVAKRPHDDPTENVLFYDPPVLVQKIAGP